MSTPSSSPSANSRHAGLILLLILALPPLFWAGNFIVARAVHAQIPPVTLSLGRWLIALVCILPFAITALRRDYRVYWQYRWRLLAVSTVGVAAFNTLVYTGLHDTTATNGTLLNSCIPIFILLFGALFYQLALQGRQVLGLALSLCGVLTIIFHGEWSYLLKLKFSHGDLIILLAMVCWAFYTLWLRELPAQLSRIGLMAVQIMIAILLLLPLYFWERAVGPAPQWNSHTAWALAYVGVFPSVIAYTLYITGVARAGAAKAGLFIHLMPVFGTLLAMAFLGESFQLYHLLGIAAILCGLFISTRNSPK